MSSLCIFHEAFTKSSIWNTDKENKIKNIKIQLLYEKEPKYDYQ
jgi:hypothetical protein